VGQLLVVKYITSNLLPTTRTDPGSKVGSLVISRSMPLDPGSERSRNLDK